MNNILNPRIKNIIRVYNIKIKGTIGNTHYNWNSFYWLGKNIIKITFFESKIAWSDYLGRKNSF